MGKCTVVTYYDKKTKLISHEVYINGIREEPSKKLPPAVQNRMVYQSKEIEKHPDWKGQRLESTIWA